MNIKNYIYENKCLFNLVCLYRQLIYCACKYYRNRQYFRIVKLIFALLFRGKFVAARNSHDATREFTHELTFVTMVKDEGLYLAEWIEYHSACMGVSKFLIYDNGSKDDIREVLRPYVEKGLVEYIWFPGKTMQIKAYTDAIDRVKTNTRWIGFFDIDEFLVPSDKHKNLIDILKVFYLENPCSAGLAIGWWMFGSNYHKSRPEGLVIENYVRRADASFMRNVKTIGNPRLMEGCLSPHYPVYAYAACNANENGLSVRGPFDYRKSTDLIHINHYFTKSEEEFITKMQKGIATKGAPRKFEDFTKRDRNEIYDDSILIYADTVRTRLQR